MNVFWINQTLTADNLTFSYVFDFIGTALDALQSMQSFLRGRPKQFKSLEYAIEWA